MPTNFAFFKKPCDTNTLQVSRTLCGARKYPYPAPRTGSDFPRGEGGVNLPNFSVGRGGGGHHREIFPEGSRDA